MFILFCMNIYSQNQPIDSIMVLNRKFKYEIGIDFQGFFKGNAGTSLILKVKKPTNGFVPLTYTTNFRFQLALSGTLPFESKVTAIDTTITNAYYNNSVSKDLFIQPMIGIERVNFYNRFNIFYGFDIGPYYHYNSNTSTYYGFVNQFYSNGYPTGGTVNNYYGIAVVPFFGVKYRLTERFSISVESGINIAYDYLNCRLNETDLNTFTNQFESLTMVKNEKRFLVNMMYLRFLNLNYHF